MAGPTPAPVAALHRLERVYTNRPENVRARAEDGRPVVGVVGADVPPELVEAAGAVAYRLHGHPEIGSAEARRILGASVDPVAHSILTRLLDGELDFLRGLVVSRDSQSSLQLFYALRELRRLDPHRGLPPVHLLDLLHLPTAATARYDEARLAGLATVLAGWTGQHPTGERLTAAVERWREVRRLLGRVSELRRGAAPPLTGTQALRVFGAVSALAAGEATDLLTDLLTDLRTGPPEPPVTHRVFLTGSAQDHDLTYLALEKLGCRVVGEDHDWGELSLTIDVESPGDPAALARGYRDRGPAAPTASVARRAEWTAQRARSSGADLLLCLVREYDEAPAWDFPAQRAALAGTAIPAVLVARRPYAVPPDGLAEALRTARPATTAAAALGRPA